MYVVQIDANLTRVKRSDGSAVDTGVVEPGHQFARTFGLETGPAKRHYESTVHMGGRRFHGETRYVARAGRAGRGQGEQTICMNMESRPGV